MEIVRLSTPSFTSDLHKVKPGTVIRLETDISVPPNLYIVTEIAVLLDCVLIVNLANGTLIDYPARTKVQIVKAKLVVEPS